MNRHPTDSAHLAPWLRSPRTARDIARAACSIEVYRCRVRWIQVLIWFVGMAAIGAMLAWRG